MRAFARAFGLVAEPFRFLQLWLLGGVANLLLARLLGEVPTDPMAVDPALLTQRFLPAMAVAVLLSGIGFLFCIPLVRGERERSLGAAAAAAVAKYPLVLGAMAALAVGALAASMVLALVLALLVGDPSNLVAGMVVVVVTFAAFVPVALHLAFFTNLIYEGREGPLAALAASWRLVRGRALELLGLMVVVFAISVVFGGVAEGLVQALSASYDPYGPTVALAAGLIYPYLALVQAGIYQQFLEAGERAAAEAKGHPAIPPEPVKPPWQGEEVELEEERRGERFVGSRDDFEGLAERFEEFKRQRREEAGEEEAKAPEPKEEEEEGGG